MARRNSNGEGTIYHRKKDGRWEGAIYVVTVSGVRKRLRIYGHSRAEVHAKLTEVKAKQQQGIPVADKNWRVDQYLDYWLDQAVRPRRRPLTYRRHEAIVRLYLKPGLGKYALGTLSVQLVQRFLDQLYSTGQSAANVHQIRKVFSAALTYAVRTELLFRNVARLVELPSYKPGEAAYWAVDEVQHFLNAAKSDPLYPMFILLVLYGLRSGEVRGIRWCDIDFDRSQLHIRQQVQRVDGVLRQVPLKTDASRRDQPLLATAREVLGQQYVRQAAARADAGTSWQGTSDSSELVFTTRSGRPIEARNLFRSFRRICAEHDIRPITLHGIRHTNATTQKDLNVHARDIQAILGHGDVRTTGIYEHVGMVSKRNALEKIEQRMFAGDRARSRQLPSNRHSVVEDTPEEADQEKYPPLWVGTFLGGSSQTRTGDTRLFREDSVSIHGRVASIKKAAQTHTRRHILGLAAVNLAVKQ